MKVTEIFTSIEGEGIWVGIPTNFIRLAGCSIRCRTCDTKYSWNDGKDMKSEEIISYLNSKVKRVSITGGEPLDQLKELGHLTNLLKKFGFNPINLETSGQKFDKDIVGMFDTYSVDLKTPSTGVEARLDCIKKFIMYELYNTQVKAVVKDKEDLEFTLDRFSYLHQLFPKFRNFVITPCWLPGRSLNKKTVRMIVNRVSKTNLPIRVIVQQHKLVYGSSKKMV